MNKEKLKTEFASKMMEIYVDRDTYSRGKIIDMTMETFTEVINENCNLDIVINCPCCGGSNIESQDDTFRGQSKCRDCNSIF